MHRIIYISALFLLASCLKKKSYPTNPIITDVEMVRYNDKDVYQIGFTDGDGDLGLEDGDTTGIYSSGSRYYYNLFMEYYHFENGAWIKPDLNGVNYYYRIPYLTPESNNKALKGSINIDMLHSFYFPNVDSVKFEITIVDRALNESEVFTTEAYITP